MKLFDLKIRTAILIVVITVISIMAVFGTYSYFSVSTLTEIGNLQSEVSSFERKLEELRINYTIFLNKKHLLNFYENKEDQTLINLQNSAKELRVLSENILKNEDLIDNDELLMYFKQAKKLLSEIDKKYNRLTGNILTLGNNEYGLESEIKQIERSAENKLLTFGSGTNLQLFYKAKKLSNNYINTETNEYADNFNNTIDVLSESIENDIQIFEDKNKRLITNDISEYKASFKKFYRITKKNGIISKSGLSGDVFSLINELKINIMEAVKIIQETKDITNTDTITSLFVWGAIAAILIAIILLRSSLILYRSLELIADKTDKLSEGKIITGTTNHSKNKIGRIFNNIEQYMNELDKKKNFIDKITGSDIISDYKPANETDEIGNSLVKLKNWIVEQKNTEEKKNQENLLKNRQIEGLAIFSNILRAHSGNLQKLSAEIITGLLDFLDANMGGFYVLTDGVLKPEAAHAYGNAKLLDREFKLGEGLIGSCAFEKNPFFFDNVPDDYIDIVSGFGSIKPKSLYISPLVNGDQIYGVIEIASLHLITESETDFINKVSNDVAATLSYMKINIETQKKLELLSKNEIKLKKEITSLKRN